MNIFLFDSCVCVVFLFPTDDDHPGGGIVVDEATQIAVRDRLLLEKLEPITVKGKSKPIAIYQPYPSRY
jgi:class 3 adenylate cyclase